jgi:septal ring factor EnvC (AmiA/AmiB activator)
MWMTKKLCGSLLLCSWLVFLPAAGLCTDTTTTSAQTQVVLSSQQYSRLKTIIEQQELRLTMLQDRLTTLRKHSTGQMQDLAELQTQLDASRTALQQTRTSLTSATASLQTATEALQRQEQSLRILTGQIKELEHKISVANRQRDTWAGIAIGLAGYLVYDHIN